MAAIKKPAKGEPVNKLWETVAQLVDAVNALQNIKFSPDTIAEIKYSDSNVMIIFKTTDKCPS